MKTYLTYLYLFREVKKLTEEEKAEKLEKFVKQIEKFINRSKEKVLFYISLTIQHFINLCKKFRTNMS